MKGVSMIVILILCFSCRTFENGVYSACYIEEGEMNFVAPKGYQHDIVILDSTYECIGCLFDGQDHKGSYIRKGNDLILSSFVTGQFQSNLFIEKNGDTLRLCGQIKRTDELLMLFEKSSVVDTLFPDGRIGTGRGDRVYIYEDNYVVLNQEIDSIGLKCTQMGYLDTSVVVSDMVVINKNVGDTIWFEDKIDYVSRRLDEERYRIKKDRLQLSVWPGVFCKNK